MTGPRMPSDPSGAVMTDGLFPLIVVHCFWGWCGHVERAAGPIAAHDAMEAHYAARHQADITRALRGINGTS